MDVGQLREHLAGLPGDLEVHVQDPAAGRSVTAAHFSRYGACIVLEADADPDDISADPCEPRPMGYIAPNGKGL